MCFVVPIPLYITPKGRKEYPFTSYHGILKLSVAIASGSCLQLTYFLSCVFFWLASKSTFGSPILRHIEIPIGLICNRWNLSTPWTSYPLFDFIVAADELQCSNFPLQVKFPNLYGYVQEIFWYRVFVNLGCCRHIAHIYCDMSVLYVSCEGSDRH